MIDERLSDEKLYEVIQMNDPTIYENLPKIANSVSNLLVQHKMILLKFGMNFRLQHCMLSIDFLGSCNFVNQPKLTPNVVP